MRESMSTRSSVCPSPRYSRSATVMPNPVSNPHADRPCATLAPTPVLGMLEMHGSLVGTTAEASKQGTACMQSGWGEKGEQVGGGGKSSTSTSTRVSTERRVRQGVQIQMKGGKKSRVEEVIAW